MLKSPTVSSETIRLMYCNPLVYHEILTDYLSPWIFLFSISISMFTRLSCFPPMNSAFSHSSTIILAVSIPITLAPNARMLVLLCCLESLAVYGSLQTTARIPSTLLAAREIPTPVPQIRIPRSTSPCATASPTFSPYTG